MPTGSITQQRVAHSYQESIASSQLIGHAFRFFAWPSGELSWNLEVALKVYLLDEDEFLGEKKHLRLILGEEVVTNHPRRHLQFINDFISLLLSIYPTTLEQDQVHENVLFNQVSKLTPGSFCSRCCWMLSKIGTEKGPQMNSCERSKRNRLSKNKKVVLIRNGKQYGMQ